MPKEAAVTGITGSGRFFVYTNAEVELEHTLKTIKWKRIEEQYA
ncbi:hypothetical protein [Paenibacillus sp. UASWS1643]|nr:hypothetical protein [Paenibacillus sp. UASWS1643]RPK30262.1 hypothetical protein EDO6_00889 [Paenibacillus xylanexedens]